MMNIAKSESSYTQSQVFSSEIGGIKLPFCSKPGLPNWNQITPSTGLIANLFPRNTPGKILYLGCGHGAGAAAIARLSPESEITCCDTNLIALRMTEETLRINSLSNGKIHPPIELINSEQGTYRSVIIELPKSRRLTQRWLVQAWNAVQPGGELFLAGANEFGVKSTIKDAQMLWGQPAILGYKKGCRLARFKKTNPSVQAPTWAVQPGIASGTWYPLTLSIVEHTLALVSLPGIFSFDRLDTGTRALLENIEIPSSARVLRSRLRIWDSRNIC